MKIKLADVGLTQYCHKGARRFIARHGLDWKQFRTEGIDAEVLRATGDQMAIDLVEQVEARHGQ